MASSNRATSATAASLQPSKARRYTLYVTLGLVSLLFLYAGGQKVLGTEQMLSNMAKMHWSAGATRLLGIFEVILVAALWWRPARTLSLSVLLLIMAGAASAHITRGDPVSGYAPIFGFALLIGGAIIADRGGALWDFLFRKGRHGGVTSATEAAARGPEAASSSDSDARAARSSDW
jgi:hypothetical protein